MAAKLPRGVFRLLILAVAMFGFAYLMVPIYNKACEIGWVDSRREAQQIAKNTQVDVSRWIRVEFVANVNEQLPWKFEPLQAGEYFKKIECFCFTRQPLKARESKDMPVVFVVPPELPDEINTITLSYTFFELQSDAAD